MLRSLKELHGYSVDATDGAVGKVSDAYFDDLTWTVRYLVVKTGGLLSRHRVLVSPLAFHRADANHGRIKLTLTREQVESSPDADFDKPVSRQYEMTFNRHYGWPDYWGFGTVGSAVRYGMDPTPIPVVRRTAPEPETHVDEAGNDAHLRSVQEVTGYHVQSLDGTIGHVEDLIIDDESWTIRYLVIDTRSWWSGRKVLISPRWAGRISWLERTVHVGLPRERIKDAPEWDPQAPVNREYEMRLYDYYGRPVYWDDAVKPRAVEPAPPDDPRTRR